MMTAALSGGGIAGFESRRLMGDGVELDVLVGGAGPPLLLLHGFPQNRLCWATVAPRLTDAFTVVIPDLRGYGRSAKPAGDPAHETYSKHVMAIDQVALMRTLGFDQFMVAGHDRGGRVAYRLALDHPNAVTKLAVLDILPTSVVWETMSALPAVALWHWTFLAQPDDLPERLIGADPDFFFRWLFARQAPGFTFDETALADYILCACDPASIHAMCEDYRAGLGVDQLLDRQDRGVRRIVAPTLALWGQRGLVAASSPEKVWQGWCDDLTTAALPCGHFVPEEAPDQVVEEFRRFFAR